MKPLLTIIFSFLWTVVNGQTVDGENIYETAKKLFKTGIELCVDERDAFDYEQVVSMFEETVALYPDNVEARYFLGYAYGRLNSKDAKGLTDMNLELMYKSSEQFEKVIELSPEYTGELLILDPYSKLSSEWGSMALYYLSHNKTDSAVWVFREGKKRGAFSDFILELYKRTLDACSDNAILLTSGDIPFFSLLYLQKVESYRTDVAVVNLSLLNTAWYPAFLVGNKTVAFDVPDAALDSIDAIAWADSTVTINGFSWILKPGFDESSLLRSDRLLLSMLGENKFQREVIFAVGVAASDKLSLQDNLMPLIIVEKLSTASQDLPSFTDYKTAITEYLKLSKLLNLNSSDEHRIFDYFFRANLLLRVDAFLNDDEIQNARELMELLDKYANDSEYPFLDANLKFLAYYFRQQLF